ncbi:UvrD-helicase domain-containing protein, partial [Vibrio parahaemolyticus]|uniref:UvrD-helicase domain-containing protein n=2 Tax=Vibrionaceae TaxID=641 RepID=UPI0011695D56
NYQLTRYQTILVDEVQDFESEWVKILRDNFLSSEGEMVLFGDESQNIYERDDKRAAVIAQGFGSWKKLKRSYRTSLESPLNQVFKDYQSKYLIEKYSDSELI